MASSTSVSAADIRHDWVVVDASDQVLGRLATRIARILSGKHRATSSSSRTPRRSS
jgi:large subunit ribosomal protein L13